jgi:DNA-binding response OmpR family regulator
MSKILVVEPRNLLRQAISLALFPDHEVQTTALLENSAAIAKEFDLVIIDSATLGETHHSSRQLVRALQGSKVPMIWIEGSEGEQAGTRDHRLVLTKPIQKHTLQSVVTTCLDNSSVKQNKQIGVTKVAAKEMKTATPSQASRPQIIELVDVVEEPPGSRNRKRQPTKMK